MLLDLAFKRSGLMVPYQSAEGRLVKRLQHIGEFVGFLKFLGKILAVDPAYRPDEGIAVLPADLTVLVAVSLIKSRLFHSFLQFHWARPCS
jgi:hypothetical protein